MRHGVSEIEMNDDHTFSAIAHSGKHIFRQMSIVVQKIEPTRHIAPAEKLGLRTR